MCSKEMSLCRNKIKSVPKDYPLVVYNSLLGNAIVNKNLVVLENHNIIMRRDYKSMKGKVKIISGGGAGIEPAESYYVGKGMLTATVLGEMFTAPSADEILIAIRELALENSGGILLLVKNYVGDKLNFSLALDKALSEKIYIKMLVIGDNITELSMKSHERKGMAGCVLIYKIAGEMAEEGKTLEEIIDECKENILTDLMTASITFAPCVENVSNTSVRFIGPNEMVLGMGIYGQTGSKKIEVNNLTNAVSICLKEMFLSQKSYFEPNKQVVVLANNFGTTSKLEESIIVVEVTKQLNEHGVKIVQFFAGTFMSSWNSHGFSISVLKINSLDTLKYLNAPTLAPAWPKSSNIDSISEVLPLTIPTNFQHDQLNRSNYESTFGPVLTEKATSVLRQITIFASEALISCERQLNIIDSEAGDGDAGTVLKKGADAIKKAIINNDIDLTSPYKFLFELSEICCKHMGGLTGALYTVFFNSAAKTFQNCHEITPKLCCSAFKEAVKAVKDHGKADLGDRTILDALYPAVNSFESAISNGKNLIQAIYLAAATCEIKSEETKFLKPSWLQAVNFNKPLLYADAGAHGVSIWLRALSEGLRLNYPEC